MTVRPKSETPERALKGIRVLVLRPEGQGGELAGLLRAEGAEPVVVPAVRIVPAEDPSKMDAVLARIGEFDWLVFTSVNGADSFLQRLRLAGASRQRISPAIAAIGPATAARLEQGGLQVAWMPEAYTTQVLAEQLPLEHLTHSPPSVCLFRADIASAELEATLRLRGFRVERVDVYGTQSINAEQIRKAVENVNAVALTSASIVHSFKTSVQEANLDSIQIFSIGPATSEACRAVGLHVDGEATRHTIRGLVEVLKESLGAG